MEVERKEFNKLTKNVKEFADEELDFLEKLREKAGGEYELDAPLFYRIKELKKFSKAMSDIINEYIPKEVKHEN